MFKRCFPHCVKSVRIRSHSGPHFPAFGLNTERYSVSLRIQSKCEKMLTRITPNTDTFHAVPVPWKLGTNLERQSPKGTVSILKARSPQHIWELIATYLAFILRIIVFHCSFYYTSAITNTWNSFSFSAFKFEYKTTRELVTFTLCTIVIKKLALYLVEWNSVRENDILVSRFNQSDTTLTHQIKSKRQYGCW